MNNIRTRIKVCGITRPEDARYVASCGVDAIGLIFYAKSPRSVSIEQAQSIVAVLSPFVSVVGLFVNAEKEEIERVLSAVPLDILQFHGEEKENDCQSFSKPYVKALRVKPETDIAGFIELYPNANGILLDAWHKDIQGGTGESFDWNLLHNLNLSPPIILAGGLDVDNVKEAITKVHPYAVDISSGVESSLGLKSENKVKQFVDEVMSV